MKWETATLIEKVKNGVDELGNVIYSYQDVRNINFRYSPYEENEVNLENRDITLTQRKVVIPIRYSDFPDVNFLRIDDTKYRIKQKMDLSPRFTMLLIERYKNG